MMSESGGGGKTRELDGCLDSMGFEIEAVGRDMVSGRLVVTEKCCQPFKVLHGGVSALIAEGLASMGAHIASDFNRIAGLSLQINHIKPARLHDLVYAQATPIHIGNTIQVWEVQLWKIRSDTQDRILISTATVTLICNLPVPPHAQDASRTLKKYAKL